MISILAKLFPCVASDHHICDRLPEELWGEIFGRLPSKSLFHCLLVCKSWRRLITSPAFVTASLAGTLKQQTSAGGGSLLLCCSAIHGTTLQSFTLRLNDGRAFPLHYSDALVPPVGSSGIVGTCNGLVCLSSRGGGKRSFILWNPVISKSLTLTPPPVRNFSTSHQIDLIGFGFGPGADDFKVLTMAASSESNIPLVCDLYSLRTESWTSVLSRTPNHDLISNQTLAFACGRLHCIARTTDGNSSNLVLVFDLTTESFSEIMLPRCLIKFPVVDSELCVKPFGDHSSIAIVKTEKRSHPLHNHFEVWVMKEYGEAESWEIAYNGVPSSLMTSWLASRPNYVGDLMMGWTFSSIMSTLDIKGETLNYSIAFAWRTLPAFVDTFTKSFALLDKGKGIDRRRKPSSSSAPAAAAWTNWRSWLSAARRT